MAKYNVLNEWFVHGKDYDDFKETLKSIDKATDTKRITLARVTFYSHSGQIVKVKDKKARELTGLECYMSKIGELTPAHEKFTKKFFLPIEKLEACGFEKEAIDELIESKTFISIKTGTEDSFYTIDKNNFPKTFAMQIDSGCEAILEPSLARDRWFAFCCEERKNKHINIVTRIDDAGNHKVFAGFSDHYCAVPQEILISAIEKFEANGTKCEFEEYHASQNITSAIFSLPDVQGDINKLYKLPTQLTPALVLQTSDTGFSSLKVWGGFIRGGKVVCKNKDCASRKHSGKIDKVTEELYEHIEKKVFSSYFEFPKKMLEAFSVTVDEEEYIPYIIKVLVKELGLIKPIGLKRWYGSSKETEEETVPILDLLCDNLRGNCFCLYDIFNEMLNLPSMLENVIENDAVNDVQEKLFNVAFLNYDKVIKNAIEMMEEEKAKKSSK